MVLSVTEQRAGILTESFSGWRGDADICYYYSWVDLDLQPNSSEFNDVGSLMIFLSRGIAEVPRQYQFILFLFLSFYKFSVVNIEFSQ